jgi:hypothetical protein
MSIQQKNTGIIELGGGAVNDQPLSAFRILASELLRHHASHGGAMDMGGTETEMVHQSRDVVRPNFHAVLLEGSLGLAVTAHIEIDTAEVP